MFRLARNLSIRTWSYTVVHVSALGTLVRKQAIATSTAAAGSGKTKATKTPASKARTSGQVNETSISASSEMKQLDIRSPPRSIKRFLWTNAKDAVLLEGVAKHRKDGWLKVAEFVGGGAKDHQCRSRNTFLEGLAKEGVKRGAWDKVELRRLEELVPQYLVRSYWSTKYKKMTEEYTDWEGVGKELGRLALHCKTKWRDLQCRKLKKGRFTAVEDALIRQRVAEWEGEGSGLWVALQREMGRASKTIQWRWNAITSSFRRAEGTIHWSDQLDERLKEGVAKRKAEGWAKVAEHVGGAVTAQQCAHRWNTYLGAMQHGNVKRGAWDQEEVETFAELVPQHVVPSYWSVQYKRMTMEYIDWTKIASKLGRLPHDCKLQWRLLRSATMKTGPFTDSEISIIRERVEGWGDKGLGLWVGLEKDLGRSAARIRSHWVNVLNQD